MKTVQSAAEAQTAQKGKLLPLLNLSDTLSEIQPTTFTLSRR